MIRALILDFDGLILDTETPLLVSWQEVYARHGVSISLQEWAASLGRSADPPDPFLQLERLVGRHLDRETLRGRRLRRELDLVAALGPMPGCVALLEAAHERGLKLAIASSSDRAWVQGHLKRLGLLARFDCVACAEDVAHTKPDPDLYVHALAGLGLQAHEAIAFEDSPNGVLAALRADLFCVAVPNNVTRHAAMAQAHLVAESLEAIDLGAVISTASLRGRQCG